MRILASVFAISPSRGSEAGIGWAVVSQLAENHDVTVLFGDLNGDQTDRADLESWIAAHPKTNRLALLYVPGDKHVRLLERIHRLPGLQFLYYAAYHAWQKLAFERAEALHRDNSFDVVHHLTYGSYREPGYLWRLKCPFLWGPVSGRGNVPWSYLGSFPIRGRIEIFIRNTLNDLTPILNPQVKQAARRAAHIWCVTAAEETFFRPFTKQISRRLEVGTSEQVTGSVRTRTAAEPLKIVWSGMHIPRKALPLFIQALASLGVDAPFHADILGAAPAGRSSTEACRRLASQSGVASKITWHGTVSHAEALRIMNEGHVFVHTSIAEATSTVVMEALACGMPVICHDISGMATAINERCGFKIPAKGPKESIRGFDGALKRFINEPALLETLSIGALERAHDLSWRKNIEQIEAKLIEVSEAQFTTENS